MSRIVEIFLDVIIDGKNTNYMISDDGRIYNKKLKHFLRPRYNNKGYLVLDLTLEHSVSIHAKVHRLVASAFIPNPENKPTVNHINGKKDDNRVENLEWATYKEQAIHAKATGLISKKYGRDLYNSKWTEEQVHHVCKLLSETYLTYKEISFLTNMSVDSIKKINERKNWTYISNLYVFRNEIDNDIVYSDDFKHGIKYLLYKGYKAKNIIHELNLGTNEKIFALIRELKKEIKEDKSSTTIEKVS